MTRMPFVSRISSASGETGPLAISSRAEHDRSAAFSPVITALGETMPSMPLWWALLFGACFGGNITLIGSTANIVALGMLEKQSHAHVGFIQWLKIGSISAFIAMVIAWAMLSVMAPHMPQ